jgi:hypothetical protein
MIKNAEIARQISDLMIEIGGRLDRSVLVLQQQCSPEESRVYGRAIGQVLGDMLDILNPLYEEHPSLKPSQME